jgi:hypothetical protein
VIQACAWCMTTCDFGMFRFKINSEFVIASMEVRGYDG